MVMRGQLKFLDLFAGAGGLSEGFIRAGFKPVAHVEKSVAACNTLKTRMTYHWQKQEGLLDDYIAYILGKTSRSDFYAASPNEIIDSVINSEISEDSLPNIFAQIDALLTNQKLDLIIGGPPCQAYSLVGRSRDKNRMVGDKRNHLYIFYAQFLKRYKPKYFVFENVRGLLTAKDMDGELYLNKMKKLFKEVGYDTNFKVLSADKFGIPQRRERVILIGNRKGDKDYYPNIEPSELIATLQEMIGDLPSIRPGRGSVTSCSLSTPLSDSLYQYGIRNDHIPVTWHIARPHTEQDLEIYRMVVKCWNKDQKRLSYEELPERLKTHKNRTSFTDRFKVVASDIPTSHTIVAHIAKDGHYYIHPDIKQNRSLSPREAARIQTFPDDYFFESATEKRGRSSAFEQIGNAVPVLLAQQIAEKLMESW
jgi:DNA (cytosine-5)-methyltransferase 1